MMVRYNCVQYEAYESLKPEKLRRRLNTFYLQRFGSGKALGEKMKKWADVSMIDLEHRRDELLRDVYLELAWKIVKTNQTRAFTSNGEEVHIVVRNRDRGFNHDMIHEFIHVLSGERGGLCTLREISHLFDEGVTEHFAQMLCDRMNVSYDAGNSYFNATTFAGYLANLDIKTLFENKFETNRWRERISLSLKELNRKKKRVVREEILSVFFIAQIKSGWKRWINSEDKDNENVCLIDLARLPKSWRENSKIMGIVRRVTPCHILGGEREKKKNRKVTQEDFIRIAKFMFRGLSINSGMWDLPGKRFDDELDDDDDD